MIATFISTISSWRHGIHGIVPKFFRNFIVPRSTSFDIYRKIWSKRRIHTERMVVFSYYKSFTINR